MHWYFWMRPRWLSAGITFNRNLLAFLVFQAIDKKNLAAIENLSTFGVLIK